jgi:hypothetical protein
MNLRIVINQFGHKPKTIVSPLSETCTLETMRKLLEAEIMFNSIPGSNLRFHIFLEEGE